LEALEKQMEAQAELQEVNDQLLAELEKRDQAVEEAVSVIVGLEDKVDRLMKEREGVRAVEADYESTYFSAGDDTEFTSSPPTFQRHRSGSDSVPRMPSFLSEQSEGTEALRSLYLPLGRSDSDAGLPKLSEESTMDGMDSPRLSVLSESSFVSIYGLKPLSLDGPPEPELPPPRKNRTAESVEKWMEARPATVAPPTRLPKRNNSIPKNHYLSINTILDSPLQRLEKLKVTLEKGAKNIAPVQPQLRSTGKTEQNGLKEANRRVIKDQDSFENQRTLPPTPDTFSTDTLRRDADLFAQNKRAGDPAFLDSTSTFAHQRSNVSIRPRSAGETVTSKRDGHGWDTETQGDYTDAGSVTDLDSMYNGPSFHRPRRVMTPDLFSFGGTEDVWGQEIKYSTAAHIPSAGNAAADRYRAERRSSMTERQKSNDHIPQRISRLAEESSHESQLYPPDRRSSLAAPTKLRKPAPNNLPAPMETLPPAVSPAKNSKISRFSRGLFGNKSESVPPSPMRTQVLPLRSPTFYDGHMSEEARATPPPIKRARTGPVPQRPMSAGTGSGAGRRLNEFGGYGVTEDVASHTITEDSVNMTRSMGSKKWLGFARQGSLRKN
jgi:hypothetical protein